MDLVFVAIFFSQAVNEKLSDGSINKLRSKVGDCVLVSFVDYMGLGQFIPSWSKIQFKILLSKKRVEMAPRKNW